MIIDVFSIIVDTALISLLIAYIIVKKSESYLEIALKDGGY